jgi:TonB-dependent receptor
VQFRSTKPEFRNNKNFATKNTKIQDNRMSRVDRRIIYLRFFCLFVAIIFFVSQGFAQQSGGIRGMVYDKEFDAPLAGAQVSIAETGEKVTASDEGSFVFGQVSPGKYTLVFSKDGYTRQVASDVAVAQGQMTDANATLSGEFTEMEEFVVQDVQLGGNSEEGLLNLRMESPAMMDSISSDLMSRAGASDAAGALRLVAGASIQDGKYAVVRGLPDRYVNSQMNGVRLPSADPEVRAVQLDQFPSAVIESIQVSKTFTPDQQGDASGGAVNVVLKGIPDESVLKFSVGTEYDTQTTGSDDFLTYKGGGLNFWGKDDGSRDPQAAGNSWKGSVGVTRDTAPAAYDWSVTAGEKKELFDGIKIGGLGSFYYKTDASSYENGIDDELIMAGGDVMIPAYTGDGSPSANPAGQQFKTSLYDVSRSVAEVQWGGLGVLGLETENHSLKFLYNLTHVAEDTVTLAEDTRGKDYYVTSLVPGYDPLGVQNSYDYHDAAPYRRSQTLNYTERDTDTLQLSGDHTLPFPEFGKSGVFTVQSPEVDWTVAKSSSELYVPDKRLFGTVWKPGTEIVMTGRNGTVTNYTDAGYSRDKPPVSYLGNVQRIWEQTVENSDQYFINGKLPFENWGGQKGYFKTGIFNDEVTREYEKDSYSNLGDINGSSPPLGWDEYWSDYWEQEQHNILPTQVDAPYDGEQKISAWYWMADFPVTSFFKVIGGARYEQTQLSTTIHPESEVYWIEEDPVTGLESLSTLSPGEGDADYQQDDVLPSIGFEFAPIESLKIRASYTETVARQTFHELTPVQQMEYLGGDVFIGNNNLSMSSLKNYDLRLDYSPYVGGLISLSWFKKDITDPIEYTQGYMDNVGLYVTPVNYPEGEVVGYEIEIRQSLGHLWNPLEGLSAGANATFLQSQVTLSDDDRQDLEAAGYPEPTRDMLNCPDHLYNLNLTYDIEKTGTQLGLFYTVQGDALIAGANRGAEAGTYIPSVYEKEYGTLTFSLSQKIGKNWKLGFKAKNLLDPEIQEVYRSKYLAADTVKTSYKKGIEYSISASCEF